MKVAMFSWESLYTIQVGGLAVSVSVLAEELVKAGHDVSVFTRSAPGQPQYMNVNGVDYHTFVQDPFPSSYALALDMSRSMVERLHKAETHAGRFDVIQGHDWLVVDALQHLKHENRAIVMTYHSTEYGRNGGRFGDWRGFKEVSDREMYAGKMCDWITTVSESMRHELNWLYDTPIEKITVIPNAIHADRYRLSIDPGQVKRGLGIHPLDPTVLFVGRLEYQKGPDILVEAIPHVLAQNSGTKFLFVGRGGMRGDLERRVSELGIGGSVRFPGFLPHWEYLEVLNACDIVCIPSRNEPFGLVLLEAWAATRPVVTTDVGGLGENVTHMENGVQVAPREDSVARGINLLLTDPALRDHIASAGRARAGDFDWDESVRRTLDVYHKAIDAAGA